MRLSARAGTTLRGQPYPTPKRGDNGVTEYTPRRGGRAFWGGFQPPVFAVWCLREVRRSGPLCRAASRAIDPWHRSHTRLQSLRRPGRTSCCGFSTFSSSWFTCCCQSRWSSGSCSKPPRRPRGRKLPTRQHRGHVHLRPRDRRLTLPDLRPRRRRTRAADADAAGDLLRRRVAARAARVRRRPHLAAALRLWLHVRASRRPLRRGTRLRALRGAHDHPHRRRPAVRDGRRDDVPPESHAARQPADAARLQVRARRVHGQRRDAGSPAGGFPPTAGHADRSADAATSRPPPTPDKTPSSSATASRRANRTSSSSAADSCPAGSTCSRSISAHTARAADSSPASARPRSATSSPPSDGSARLTRSSRKRCTASARAWAAPR